MKDISETKSQSYVPYDSDKVFREINRSLRSSKNWDLSNEDWPVKNLDVAHSKARNNTAKLSFRTSETDIFEYQDIPDNIISKCNKLVGKLGDEATDLFIVVKHLWALKANIDSDFVQISLEEIAPLLGYSTTKKGGYASYVKRKVFELMELLSFLFLDAELAIWGYNEVGKKVKITHCKRGKILVFDSMEKTTYEIDGEEKKISYSWQVKPGGVIAPLLRDPNKRFAYIDKKVLSYRSTGQVFAKRIGDACSWYFRINFFKNGGLVKIKVRAMLENCLLPIDSRNPGRTIDRFSEACETLKKDNVVQSIIYENVSIKDLIIDRPRGYFDQWLESIIIITPSDKLTSCYSSITSERKVLPIKKESPRKLEPNKIAPRKTATIRPSNDKLIDSSLQVLIDLIHYDDRITITHLAQLLDVSRPYLSMVIRGKKPPSKRLIDNINVIRNKGLLEKTAILAQLNVTASS